jgi:hypothetical protein
MTPTEQDKELRALLGEMPYFVIDWLELSDELRQEWKKGGKASDFGGHHAFMQKYEKKLADFITADRKRVALGARIDAAEHILNTMVHEAGGYCDEIDPDDITNYIAELKSQQEEV